MKQILFLILISCVSKPLHSQSDTLRSKVSFEMDYRFRVEHDWNSIKSDGVYRTDRSRLRYRLRAGASYTYENYSFGARIRTGNPQKQQDPQLTIGKAYEEFGTLPIGFEKAYFEYNKNNLKFWLGKNTFPFRKNNELFWSDNVFPEGLTFKQSISINKGPLEKINLIAAHFILSSNDGSFFNDAYFQGFQTNFQSRDQVFSISSAFYFFKNIPNIPDGGHTFQMPYAIVNLSAYLYFGKFKFDLDYYNNIQDYRNNINIEQKFKNHKTGFTFGIQHGNIDLPKNWMFKLTYAYLQRYSVLDYMAQNDWARWDYASLNSPDGRLSNLQGIELVVKHSITKKINLVSKYYLVEQLLPLGIVKENGQRIRFDLNIKI